MSCHPLPAPPAGSPWLTEEYRNIEAFLARYATSSKPPTRWQDRYQWEMAVVHCVLLDLLKRTYLYADYAVENEDLANYLGFAQVALFQTYNHHHFEETKIFPFMDQAAESAALTHNVDEHHTFSEPLHATLLYLHLVRELLIPAPPPSPLPDLPVDILAIDLLGEYGLDPSKPFDPVAHRKHMDTWILPLARHLRDEIDTLGPEYMEQIGEATLKDLNKIVTEHLQGYDPSWFLCSSFASAHVETCKELIKLPYLVRRLFIPFWWGRKYWGYWLYCSHPENLTFSGTA